MINLHFVWLVILVEGRGREGKSKFHFFPHLCHWKEKGQFTLPHFIRPTFYPNESSYFPLLVLSIFSYLNEVLYCVYITIKGRKGGEKEGVCQGHLLNFFLNILLFER